MVDLSKHWSTDHKNNYINKSLVQHRVFEKEGIPASHNFFDYKTDYEVLDKIKNDIPINSSKYENSLVINSNDHIVYNKVEHHISNEPIDNSVYEDSVFSWVNPSLPDKKNYVFINQSTFSPVLHYHPILWFGHTHLIKCFKEYGYKSFDWLFDESYDELTSDLDTFKANVKQVDKVMNTIGAGDAYYAAILASNGDLHFANSWAAYYISRDLGENVNFKEFLVEYEQSVSWS